MATGFCTAVRSRCRSAARCSRRPTTRVIRPRDGGVYGHVDGPRFNTPSEIAQLAACGVVAVSQTGGPETVLCGELELPYALLGFATDYANEVTPGDPTPVSTLIDLMGRSSAIFAGVLRSALPGLDGSTPSAAGTVYRLEHA